MAPGSIALVVPSEPMLRNGDQFYPFRQHSDFFYLTGINQAESMLLLAPGSTRSSLPGNPVYQKANSEIRVYGLGPVFSPRGQLYFRESNR